MKLCSNPSAREVSAGFEEEGEGEGVDTNLGSAEVEHLVVEEDGMLRRWRLRVDFDEGVPDDDAGLGDLRSVEGGGD